MLDAVERPSADKQAGQSATRHLQIGPWRRLAVPLSFAHRGLARRPSTAALRFALHSPVPTASLKPAKAADS